jgi:uncharacterized protein
VQALDTNILIYAHRSENIWHPQAREFLTNLTNSGEIIGIPYHCLIEFTGIVTNPRIFKEPTPLDEALDQCDRLLSASNLKLLTDTPESFAQFRKVITQAKATGAMVHDARIIALCLENAVKTFYSADRDFSRYAGLKIVNPLVTARWK